MENNYFGDRMRRWDRYFHDICIAVSAKSPCLSRKIGTLLVRDHSIVSTGYNGPPRGYPHCGPVCPRHKAGLKSGQGLELCPAVHAEVNAIANAARVGATTIGTTLYMNCCIPCKSCLSTLINAGIVEIVVDEVSPYDELSQKMLKECNIKVRNFRL